MSEYKNLNFDEIKIKIRGSGTANNSMRKQKLKA